MQSLRNRLVITLVLMLASAAGSRADLIDTFNSENGGVGSLNYSNFANFNVTSGSVDLIGNGFFDFYPGNGLYVDLDGSTNQGGTMVTKASFAAGLYSLSFDLGGSQRGDTNIVDVAFGPYAESFIVPSGQPLTTITRTVTIVAPSTLSFRNEGGDNVGAILDNVGVRTSLAIIPEPASIWLLSFGCCGLLGYAWRRKRDG